MSTLQRAVVLAVALALAPDGALSESAVMTVAAEVTAAPLVVRIPTATAATNAVTMKVAERIVATARSVVTTAATVAMIAADTTVASVMIAATTGITGTTVGAATIVAIVTKAMPVAAGWIVTAAAARTASDMEGLAADLKNVAAAPPEVATIGTLPAPPAIRRRLPQLATAKRRPALMAASRTQVRTDRAATASRNISTLTQSSLLGPDRHMR